MNIMTLVCARSIGLEARRPSIDRLSFESAEERVRRLDGRPFRTRHPEGPTKSAPMNQFVRMSHFNDADAIEEPSPTLRVPFAQSGAFVCKYIIGEPDDQALCCGAPVPDGKSWCAFHRRIVFEPARPPRLR